MKKAIVTFTNKPADLSKFKSSTKLYLLHKHHLSHAPLQFPTQTKSHSYFPKSLSTQIAIGVLPTERGRNGCSIREDVIQDLVGKYYDAERCDEAFDVEVICDTENQVIPAGLAISKCFPIYTRKTNQSTTPPQITVTFKIISPQNLSTAPSAATLSNLQHLSDSCRMAARLVDMPTDVLNTKTYVDNEIVPEVAELKKILDARGKGEKIVIKVIKGTELRDQGFGGIWGVGKGAENLPAMVILSYTTPTAKKAMSWVGKGIVYDSGGLSIKVGGNMCGMKADMGGSAAVFTGFRSYLLSGNDKYYNLTAILCLAENSVSDRSFRNDDVLDMYSGKTVEINNTDAEGRLVLADGVAYATKNCSPDIVIDIATLTGAVLICTGKKVAGLLCNDEGFENQIVEYGKNVGDLVFPILYAPELLLGAAKIFKSDIADMKNSVSDRMNAQASCAGHFVEEHLVGEKWDWKKLIDNTATVDQKGLWAHLDIAGTATDGKHGTGAGCALLFEIADKFRC